MANSRLEELRRRAQERIQQVRESMERETGDPPPPPIYQAPAEPPTAQTHQPGPSQQSLEGPSLEGPGLEVPQPRVEGPREQAQVQRPQPEQPRAQRAAPPARTASAAPAGPREHHRGHHSGAAKILNRDTIRQAILAQEILGKPVSLRPPRENEDL